MRGYEESKGAYFYRSPFAIRVRRRFQVKLSFIQLPSSAHFLFVEAEHETFLFVNDSFCALRQVPENWEEEAARVKLRVAPTKPEPAEFARACG